MSPDELLEISLKLSQEKLYIQTERETIARLNQDVSTAAAQVCKTAWLVRQQRTNLSRITQDDPSLCCMKANVLENTNFVDAFHHLNYHESKFSTFLKLLKDDPTLVAEFINLYPSQAQHSMTEIIDILMSAVYGSCVSVNEEMLVASVLRHLSANLMSNPLNQAERVITKSRCSWCTLYKAYTDSLSACKLFLAAALYQPIINLLTRDDWFYDIEDSKVLERFPPAQRMSKFGQPGTDSYSEKTKSYRRSIVQQLHKFAMDFIEHIKSAVMSFPVSLQWLISHINKKLNDTERYNNIQSRHLCTELIFDLFICPAVIDPMLYGLTADVTVSHIARHNLMQVARILQVLSKGQRSEERQRVPDLYSLFDEDCLVGVMDVIIQEQPSERLRLNRSSGNTTSFTRSSIFIGTQQLDILVEAFREAVSSQPEDSEFRLKSESAVKSLPRLQLNASAVSTSAAGGGEGTGTPTTNTPSHSPQTKPKRRTTKRLQHNDSFGSVSSIPTFTAQEVMTITVEDTDPIGLLEEEKVLSSVEESRESGSRIDGGMKKTRFYLGQDQESIGNTSEYQASELADAISEAASVRSERSTNLDDAEDEDDNLSDMVSANVSGRGSPNISGRETPQSVDDGAVGGERAQPNLPTTAPKPNNDLTDRFGKFGIDIAIDNRSLVSDSWSTDVYGSDSEPPETQDEVMGAPLIHEMISETASESAWSTDVLNSDTSERPSDRLGEVDQIDESLTSIDQGSESDAMSTRSTDSRRGEPSSPFIPVRQPNLNTTSTLPNLPAFPNPLLGADGVVQRPPSNSLNHSVGSSFMSSHPAQGQNLASPFSTNRMQAVSPVANQLSAMQNQSANQMPSPLSNQFSMMNTLQPLQPIRTQMPGNTNVLDMFDPLSDELLTPPISQGSVLNHHSHLMDNQIPTRQAWASSANHQSAYNAQQSDWARASGASTDEGRGTWATSQNSSNAGSPGWQAQAPWGSTPNRAQQSSNPWDSQSNKVQTNPWSTNQNQANNNPANQGSLSAPQSADVGDDPWASIAPVETRPRTWNSNSGGRNTVTPANRFAVIEDEHSGDLINRPSTWANQSQSQTTRGQTSVTNIVTSGQAVANNTAASATNITIATHGAIPKQRGLPRTNSQGSAMDDVESGLIQPGRMLGKEKKGMLSLIKKGSKKRDRSSGGKIRPRVESPAISEPREEATSSASDDSGRLKRGEPRRDSERSDKAESVNEDLLEKYRGASKAPANGAGFGGAVHVPPSLTGEDVVDEPSVPIYDPENLEKCLAFADAKKKLRLVLSTPTLSLYTANKVDISGGVGPTDNFLVQYLHLLYAEALIQQNIQLTIHIQETIRCLQRFSNHGCRKLMRSLREEYQSRVHYISYLAKSRQRLLGMQARIQGMLQTLNRDKENCFESLIQECVRVFLDKKDAKLKRLQNDFSRLQPDEKVIELEQCLSFLNSEIDRDDMWNGANTTMREAAQVAVERGVMERVYKLAMFPNADGDTQRDKIYTDSVAKLGQTVTPNHRKLRIPAAYHLEAPWSSAQAHLIKINAFKTPRDKVQCVCQCVDTIMGLLKLAHTKSVPGADDFLPVFIYVLIMANPPYLLSTLQYVENLFGSRMEGEEAYNWTQLNTAVAFIKMWLQEDEH